MRKGKEYNREENDIDRAAQSAFDDDDSGEDGQQEMFNDELSRIADAIADVSDAPKYEIKIAIVLKAVADNSLPETIPVLKGKFLKEHIEEIIEMFIKGEPFRRRLRAVVGHPSGQLVSELREAQKSRELKEAEEASH